MKIAAKRHLVSISVMAAVIGLLTTAQAADDPINLETMGSFHIGGRLAEISGKPVKEMLFSAGGVPVKVDPNGTYQVEQMYVQYFIPAKRRGSVPLLMWHGGGYTGVTYESTPDGRDGWLNYFLRKGWSVYNSDAVERGRSGWAQYPEIFKSDPVFLTTANPFERFRIGDGEGSFSQDPSKRRYLPGSQFPADGYDNMMKQIVPRWTTTDDPIFAAYLAEVDKVCPCVILFHSQSGPFAFKAAQARPDKVKALVAVEPAQVGDPDKVAALKGVPVLMIYGDFIAQDKRWPTIRKNGLAFAEKIRAAGGSVDVVDLPEIGIKGNSHFPMMDKNNREVADLIQKWLSDRGLYQ